MPVYIFNTFDEPLASTGTFAFGINDFGQIVGTYAANGVTHGFLLSTGTYITLDDPATTQGTQAFGINDVGQIVGVYFDSKVTEHGFLLSGGIYTTLDDPLATQRTSAAGINDVGQIVGFFVDGFDSTHGFVAIPEPNPSPPAGTTADMILRGSNASPAVMGQYEIYDIGNNAILAAYSLGQVGTDWAFVTLGGFFDGDTTDMLLRNSNTGAFE